MATNDAPAEAVSPGVEPQGTEPDVDLSAADEELAVLLSQGHTQQEAGEIIGLSDRTVRRRLDDARFRARVEELRRQRVTETTTRLMHLADTALAALEELLGSENESVRFRAAQAVLTMGRRHHREDAIESDLAERVETMEALFEGVAEKLK